jgi:hypothetical protein
VARADAKAALIRRKGRSERDIGPVDKIEGPEA